MIPVWRFLPPALAHALAPSGLSCVAAFYGRDFETDEGRNWLPFSWRGLHFPNRFGLAGGADKDAERLLDWQSLGAGFVEIGTITPRPQKGNPGKVMDRDWEARNLWNKMGFPSQGAHEVRINLESHRDEVRIPILVNIGKNRETSPEMAVQDYLSGIESFKQLADTFVVNISSPNTQGLRLLQNPESLRPLCEAVVKAAGEIPVLVKLSPDQSEAEFKESLDVAASAGVAGFVLTNTTLSRPQGCPFPPEGGLSGHGLKSLSESRLRDAVRLLGSERSRFLLVSVGGISNVDDAKRRLDLGADLLELYSALIFEGPRLFQKLREEWPRISQK